jgi:hypothetical protein
MLLAWMPAPLKRALRTCRLSLVCSGYNRTIYIMLSIVRIQMITTYDPIVARGMETHSMADAPSLAQAKPPSW